MAAEKQKLFGSSCAKEGGERRSNGFAALCMLVPSMHACQIWGGFHSLVHVPGSSSGPLPKRAAGLAATAAQRRRHQAARSAAPGWAHNCTAELWESTSNSIYPQESKCAVWQKLSSQGRFLFLGGHVNNNSQSSGDRRSFLPSPHPVARLSATNSACSQCPVLPQAPIAAAPQARSPVASVPTWTKWDWHQPVHVKALQHGVHLPAAA